ncbi:MAG: SCO family protein [Cytophagales bacterium]|nr:SCO family protein [Cytophagales bacterium]
MNTSLKAGILIAMLVVPALVFLFLKGFGQNHYSLPRYIPRIDSASGRIMTVQREVNGREITDTLFRTLPDFRMTNQQGQVVTQEAVKGKIHVADFFFARCLGICPKMSSQLQRVQEAFLNDPNVVILSYTVDPEHDSVPAVQHYADQYEARAGKWHLLTGEKRDIYHLAKYGYYVTAKEDDTTSTNLEEQFVHTDKFVLVDRDGVIRGFYNGTSREDVDKLILEIKVLLHEYDNDKTTAS